MASNHDDLKELLLAHISPIRESVDRIETKLDKTFDITSDHEIRLVKLEVAPKQEKSNERWSKIFTAIGSFVAGVFGGKLT